MGCSSTFVAEVQITLNRMTETGACTSKVVKVQQSVLIVEGDALALLESLAAAAVKEAMPVANEEARKP